MELYLIEDYQESYPDLSGKELTDALVMDILSETDQKAEHRDGRKDWQRLVIRRLPQGKPVLRQLTAEGEVPGPWIFSVSHTKNMFGCVIAPAEERSSRGASIGLDLQFRRTLRMERLAGRYFTEEENRYLKGDASGKFEDPAELEHRFFRLWTRKEALAKYTGEGLSAVLAKEPVLGRRDVRFQDLVLPDGLYGCICSRI